MSILGKKEKPGGERATGNMAGVCLVCRINSPLSSEGIFIRGKFICTHCEGIISRINAGDLLYSMVKDSLKEIWFTGGEEPYFS